MSDAAASPIGSIAELHRYQYKSGASQAISCRLFAGSCYKLHTLYFKDRLLYNARCTTH